MLQYRFGVKLHNWCVDYKTSPDLPSAWEWIDNDRSFYLWLTCPLKGEARNNVCIYLLLKKNARKRQETGMSLSVFQYDSLSDF